MRTLVVLAAGKSTRLEGAYKPNLLVGGKRMIDWQKEAAAADRAVVVAHNSQHFPNASQYTLYTEERRGPAQALQCGLLAVPEGDVLVALADTWWSTTPSGTDWVGVCPAEGGRIWDYPADGGWERGFIPHDRVLPVCIGLYSFSRLGDLWDAIDKALTNPAGEISMAEVLAHYDGLDKREVPEWLDVGDTPAWKHADRTLRGVI